MPKKGPQKRGNKRGQVGKRVWKHTSDDDGDSSEPSNAERFKMEQTSTPEIEELSSSNEEQVQTTVRSKTGLKKAIKSIIPDIFKKKPTKRKKTAPVIHGLKSRVS